MWWGRDRVATQQGGGGGWKASLEKPCQLTTPLTPFPRLPQNFGGGGGGSFGGGDDDEDDEDDEDDMPALAPQ